MAHHPRRSRITEPATTSRRLACSPDRRWHRTRASDPVRVQSECGLSRHEEHGDVLATKSTKNTKGLATVLFVLFVAGLSLCSWWPRIAAPASLLTDAP